MIDLKTIFYYLKSNNLRNSNIANTNIYSNTFSIDFSQSPINLVFELSLTPYSKDHTFVYYNQEIVNPNNYIIYNNIIEIVNTEFLIPNDNNIIEIFFFGYNASQNPVTIDYAAPLEFDEFVGGSHQYNLKIGALDSRYIIVTKNQLIISDYTIQNGLLTLSESISSTLLDKFRVYYLNRGLIERRAKIGLHQLDNASLSTRYRLLNDTMTKTEVDSLIYSLKGQLPIGLDSLAKFAQAIANSPDFYAYVENELNKKSDLSHNHSDIYYTKTLFNIIQESYHAIDTMVPNDELDEQITIKANRDQVYTKAEIDHILTSLPGNNPNNRGIFISGGISNSPMANSNLMDIVNIAVLSNASFFGNFSAAKRGLASTSNGVGNVGLVGGGDSTTSIFSVSIANGSNTQYFGDYQISRHFATSNSNGTGDVAITVGGHISNTSMEYCFISNSAVSSGVFGQASINTTQTKMTSVSSGRNNRIVFGPSFSVSTGTYNSEYVNPSNLSNSLVFGTMTPNIHSLAGTSNDTNGRGVFISGVENNTGLFTKTIQSLTINTLGNTTIFGDCMTGRTSSAAISNGVNNRALIAGGNTGVNQSDYNYTSEIEYFDISQESNAMVFGNLVLSRGDGLGGISNGAI